MLHIDNDSQTRGLHLPTHTTHTHHTHTHTHSGVVALSFSSLSPRLNPCYTKLCCSSIITQGKVCVAIRTHITTFFSGISKVKRSVDGPGLFLMKGFRRSWTDRCNRVRNVGLTRRWLRRVSWFHVQRTGHVSRYSGWLIVPRFFF